MRRSSDNYRIYEAIHPVSDSEQTVVDYLDTLEVEVEFFDGKTILDCGYGGIGWALDLFLKSNSKKVYGIDINANWIPVMENKFKEFSYKLDLQNGELLDLPYSDNYFDYVHCHGVLHHIQNWETGLTELCRVVKNGGTLYLMVYGQYGPLGRVVNNFLRQLGKVIPFRMMNLLVEKLGLFSNHEYSILDMMYVETELHFSGEVIQEALEKLKFNDIQFHKSTKWARHRIMTSGLLFGKNVNHIVTAKK
jgi:ubiquinone/menaquinone biosynthesis C-methylase UbiE